MPKRKTQYSKKRANEAKSSPNAKKQKIDLLEQASSALQTFSGVEIPEQFQFMLSKTLPYNLSTGRNYTGANGYNLIKCVDKIRCNCGGFITFNQLRKAEHLIIKKRVNNEIIEKKFKIEDNDRPLVIKGSKSVAIYSVFGLDDEDNAPRKIKINMFHISQITSATGDLIKQINDFLNEESTQRIVKMANVIDPFEITRELMLSCGMENLEGFKLESVKTMLSHFVKYALEKFYSKKQKYVKRLTMMFLVSRIAVSCIKSNEQFTPKWKDFCNSVYMNFKSEVSEDEILATHFARAHSCFHKIVEPFNKKQIGLRLCLIHVFSKAQGADGKYLPQAEIYSQIIKSIVPVIKAQ